MKVSPVQMAVMVEIDSAVGHELEANDIPTLTFRALLRKGLIEPCARMYFGPRTARYRLTIEAKVLLAEPKMEKERTI